MDEGLIAALIGAAVALVGIGVAAVAAVYQITKQARMGLKVELYREVLSAVEAQGDAERELSTKLGVLRSLIGVWLRPQQFGGILPGPNTSWAEVHDLAHRTQGEAADLTILTERWQVVEPKLDLFGLAFGSALHDLRRAWPPLSEALASIIPVVPGGPAPAQPSKEALEAAAAAIDRFLRETSKLSAWVADFQLEMQSLLLADLFHNRLSHREPPDPTFFVVRLDRYETLKDYFLNQSAWAREMQEVNERTKAAIEKRAG